MMKNKSVGYPFYMRLPSHMYPHNMSKKKKKNGSDPSFNIYKC
jgi:hypothetical protein